MRVAALVKQVPKVDALQLATDGRLVRDGLELETNPYCRRAVAKGVELASTDPAGECIVFTLGPPAAEDVLREAIACGATRGVLLTDGEFAGSDTLASAKALAAALTAHGPFDLILTGRNSVDADTGQVGAQVAELLGLPFAAGVKQLAVDGTRAWAQLEHDDGRAEVELVLPAVLSCAERLCDPAKAEPERRSAVDPRRVQIVSARELGDGPWGVAASPTRVVGVEVIDNPRAGHLLEGPLDEQVRAVVARIRELLDGRIEFERVAECVPDDWERGDAPIVVLAERGRLSLTRELASAAARLAREIGAHVVVAGPEAALDLGAVGAWGADRAVVFEGSELPESIVTPLVEWCRLARPWALLGPSTSWGRELMSRSAVQLDAGLIGDAIAFEVRNGRLVALKPAFGGRLVASVVAESEVQMATARPHVFPALTPRHARAVPVERMPTPHRGRVRVAAEARDDDLSELAVADVVIGVGLGIRPDEYDALGPLQEALGAVLGATRKVTDRGWLPRSRQIGVTGRSIAPQLYVAIGVSGKLNHMIGVRAARCVIAVNSDPSAPVFAHADIGIVGDWREVVPLLTEHLIAAGFRGDDTVPVR